MNEFASIRDALPRLQQPTMRPKTDALHGIGSDAFVTFRLYLE